MGVICTTVKRAWRTLVPPSLDQAAFSGQSAPSRLILASKRWLETFASHEELYDADYYRRERAEMAVSGPAIAGGLVARCAPASAIDVGCGSGAVIVALRELGVAVAGLEYCEAAFAICRDLGLAVHRFDIESDALVPLSSAELVIGTEVAGHLPARVAERYVNLLCRLAGTRQGSPLR
jgi:SAM-dependent methyltransferase